MMYARARLRSSGTYTTGIGLDWSLQFDTSSSVTAAVPTAAGEVSFGSCSYGICIDYGLITVNPCDISVYVEVPAGKTVQVRVDGNIQEIAASGLVTLSLIAGYNLIRFTCDVGPLLILGPVFDGVAVLWSSPYFAGADRFVGATGGRTVSGVVMASPVSTSPTTA